MARVTKVPGIFRVDGVTLTLVKKLVTKQMQSWTVGAAKRQPSPSEYETEFNSRVTDMYAHMKPKAVSKEFASPEAAQEYLDLVRSTTPKGEQRDLSIKIHVASLDKSGGVKRNKKTFKPVMTWQKYDTSYDYSEITEALKKVA